MIAGYETWKQLGRQVDRGQKGIRILAPVRRRDTAAAEAGRDRLGGDGPPAGPAAADSEAGARPVAFRLAHVWDVSQTSGDPLPAQPAPQLLAGAAPDGLWDRLAALAAGRGFSVERGDCAEANGYTAWASRSVRVRDDVDDGLFSADIRSCRAGLQDPRPRPIDRTSGRSGTRCPNRRCARDTPLLSLLPVSPAHPAGLLLVSKERGSALEQFAPEASRDVTTLAVASAGGVVVGEGVPGTVVTDAAWQPVAVISDYPCSLLACGASAGTVRSYSLALLRWGRFLAAVAVTWDRAIRDRAAEWRRELLYGRADVRSGPGRNDERDRSTEPAERERDQAGTPAPDWPDLPDGPYPPACDGRER